MVKAFLIQTVIAFSVNMFTIAISFYVVCSTEMAGTRRINDTLRIYSMIRVRQHVMSNERCKIKCIKHPDSLKILRME